MFWIGFLAGAVAGGTLGAVIMAACAAAKRADINDRRAHEIVDLNHHTNLAPDDPNYVADRSYREKGDGQTYRR
jgi:uncharacterized protein YdbL (DUF1318 family)